MGGRSQALSKQPTETVGLADIADRVLAAPIFADHDIPAHDIAPIDGYAVDVTMDTRCRSLAMRSIPRPIRPRSVRARLSK
jgi:molybdopterin biosynthesis enzyme